MAITDWSTTASTNATADGAIDWQEGQNPSTINNSARAMMAALKSWHLDLSGLALGGSGNSFTLTPAQPLASLTNAIYGFIADRANTGAVTLSVSGLTAKPLRRYSGTDLSANQIVSGGFYIAAYDTSNQEWLLTGARSLANADLPSMNNNTVKANISGSAAVPSDVTIDNLINAASANSVALSKLPTQADSTVLANVSGGVAVPSAVTVISLIAEILTTRGDILRFGSTAPERLAIGASGKVLVSDGTDAAWGYHALGNLTGGSICLQRVRAETGAEVACYTALPFDNTIPQSSEGVEVLTASITPVSASSKLVVRFTGWASRISAASNYIGAALFRDSGADALGATAGGVSAGAQPILTTLSGEWEISAGSTSATTFKIRVGGDSGDVYFLGYSNNALWGGVGKGSITIEEWLTV